MKMSVKRTPDAIIVKHIDGEIVHVPIFDKPKLIEPHSIEKGVIDRLSDNYNLEGLTCIKDSEPPAKVGRRHSAFLVEGVILTLLAVILLGIIGYII